MTRLIVSTSIRRVPPDVPSGHLYVVDLDTLKIRQKTGMIEAPYRQFDLNPRGGIRGVKGMGLFQNELAVANYSVLFIFDCKWNLVRAMTHPSVSGIHEIYFTEHGIWVTSTANDMLVKFDRDGNLHELDYLRMRQDLLSPLQGPSRQNLSRSDIMAGRMDFRNRSHFRTDDYDRLHLNGIDMYPDGRIVMSLGLIVGELFATMDILKTLMMRLGIWSSFLAFNRWVRARLALKKHVLSDLVAQPLMASSAIVSGHPKAGWQTHLQYPTAQNPSHSPRLLEDGTILYLDSSRGKLIHFDKQGNILADPVISDKFLRGLLILPNGQLAIGAGNSLLFYDLTRQEIVTHLELAEAEDTSIFDIKLLPENFDLPPESLEAKFGRIVGFDGRNIIWAR